MSWIKFAVAGIALCAGASVASAQGGPPDNGMRGKMEDMQEAQRKELRQVLTEDQRKIFDVNADAMKERREEMMKQRQRGADSRLTRLDQIFGSSAATV